MKTAIFMIISLSSASLVWQYYIGYLIFASTVAVFIIPIFHVLIKNDGVGYIRRLAPISFFIPAILIVNIIAFFLNSFGYWAWFESVLVIYLIWFFLSVHLEVPEENFWDKLEREKLSNK